MIPPFCGRKPTGGVGDLPLSKFDPRGESIAECCDSVFRGRVDDRMGELVEVFMERAPVDLDGLVVCFGTERSALAI